MSIPSGSSVLQTNTRRAVRVAKGLADPESRPRYVDAVRSRARGLQRFAGRSPRCLVCRSYQIRPRSVAFARNKSNVCDLHICGRCGFIRNLTNSKSKYQDLVDLDELPASARAGTHQRPGREYYMAKMAVDIMDRDDVEVLVYGAGRSFDNYHIEQLEQVRNVAIGDIMKVRDDAEFIDANQPAPRRFPIVIASEVVEHFREPRVDFAKLFKLVERNGLVVCSTNIYAGGSLAKDRYLFYKDHTAYYTPSALRRIAKDAGFHLDFRVPKVGSVMRKRYVLFTKSADVLQDVACYFGTQVYAPSEADASRAKT